MSSMNMLDLGDFSAVAMFKDNTRAFKKNQQSITFGLVCSFSTKQ